MCQVEKLCFADTAQRRTQHGCKRQIIIRQNGKVLVTDQDSQNGTFVRIKDEVRLHHSDYVLFGSELMRVEINL